MLPQKAQADSRLRKGMSAPGRGFTLVELLAVMVIISIILTFILVAAMDSMRRAEERATQSLITKLENGINDRLDALLQTQPDPSRGHLLLAGVYSSSMTQPVPGPQRAAVLAAYDYLKRELPDVFYVRSVNPGAQGYPLNFAGNPYPDPNAPLPLSR